MLIGIWLRNLQNKILKLINHAYIVMLLDIFQVVLLKGRSMIITRIITTV